MARSTLEVGWLLVEVSDKDGQGLLVPQLPNSPTPLFLTSQILCFKRFQSIYLILLKLCIFNNKFCARTPRASKLQNSNSSLNLPNNHTFTSLSIVCKILMQGTSMRSSSSKSNTTNTNLTSPRGRHCVNACELAATKDNPSPHNGSQSNL